MIDIVQLSASVVGALVTLLIKATEKGVEKAGEHVSGTLFDALKKRLSPSEAKAALDDLASDPRDLDAQAALRRQIRKALETDPKLAAELQTFLGVLEPPNSVSQVAIVTGNGSVIKQISGGHNNSIS